MESLTTSQLNRRLISLMRDPDNHPQLNRDELRALIDERNVRDSKIQKLQSDIDLLKTCIDALRLRTPEPAKGV